MEKIEIAVFSKGLGCNKWVVGWARSIHAAGPNIFWRNSIPRNWRPVSTQRSSMSFAAGTKSLITIWLTAHKSTSCVSKDDHSIWSFLVRQALPVFKVGFEALGALCVMYHVVDPDSIVFAAHWPEQQLGAAWNDPRALENQKYVDFQGKSQKDAVACVYSTLHGTMDGLIEQRIDAPFDSNEDD